MAIEAALYLYPELDIMIDFVHFRKPHEEFKTIGDIDSLLPKLISKNELSRIEYDFKSVFILSALNLNSILAQKRYDLMIIGLRSGLALPKEFSELSSPVLRVCKRNQAFQFRNLIYIGDSEAIESLHGFDLLRKITRSRQVQLDIWKIKKGEIKKFKRGLLKEYFHEKPPSLHSLNPEEAMLQIKEIANSKSKQTLILCNCFGGSGFVDSYWDKIPIIAYNKLSVNFEL